MFGFLSRKKPAVWDSEFVKGRYVSSGRQDDGGYVEDANQLQLKDKSNNKVLYFTTDSNATQESITSELTNVMQNPERYRYIYKDAGQLKSYQIPPIPADLLSVFKSIQGKLRAEQKAQRDANYARLKAEREDPENIAKQKAQADAFKAKEAALENQVADVLKSQEKLEVCKRAVRRTGGRKHRKRRNTKRKVYRKK